MTGDDNLAAPGDDGFTLLEVLVALVLSSLLMIAVGGLFVFVGQLHEQSEETEVIERSLLDLRSAESLLNGWSTGIELVSLTGVSATGFTLRKLTPAGTVTSTANVAVDKAALTVGDSSHASSVDLSAFDDVEFEYLTLSAQTANWVKSDQLGAAEPRAIRVDLKKADRRWLVMLWMDNGR